MLVSDFHERLALYNMNKQFLKRTV